MSTAFGPFDLGSDPAPRLEQTRMPGRYWAIEPCSDELTAWRLLGPRLLSSIERELAAQGDHAEPELIDLQHRLAELLQPRAFVLTPQHQTSESP